MDGKQFGGIRFEICHSIGSITIIALNEAMKIRREDYGLITKAFYIKK